MGFQNCSYDVEKMANALGVSEQAVQNAMYESMRGGFARVWAYSPQTTKNDKEYGVVELSTSKKRRDGNGYDNDFQSKYVTFVGTGYTKLRSMQIGQKGVTIQITSCSVSRNYDKATKKEHVNYTVYDFVIPDSNGNGSYNNRQNGSGYGNYQSNYTPSEQKIPIPDEYEDELPF